MTEAFAQLNWLAVLAASVAHFLLGAVWFVGLFGRRYAVVMGIADRPAQPPAPLALIGPFLCSALTIATTGILLNALPVAGYGDALRLGGLVGIGYLAPMTLNIAINPLFPHPFRYALLNVPMFLIGSLMASAILWAMG